MFDNQISTVFSSGVLRKVLNNQQISMIEYSILIGTLVGHNIPFESAFVSGTRKNAASFQLTIHINPSTSLVLVVALEPGASVYSPSP